MFSSYATSHPPELPVAATGVRGRPGPDPAVPISRSPGDGRGCETALQTGRCNPYVRRSSSVWIRAYPGRSGGRILRDGVAFCCVGYSKGKNALEGQARLGIIAVKHRIICRVPVHTQKPAHYSLSTKVSTCKGEKKVKRIKR